jgi:hypothetical protein
MACRGLGYLDSLSLPRSLSPFGREYPVGGREGWVSPKRREGCLKVGFFNPDGYDPLSLPCFLSNGRIAMRPYG